ncbi:MAG: AAA family ATPase [Candidatus Heimdallarchaeota archaeon]|nr:AAA family ATPase [Candidatus Heimdallarchaeota archaeon]
MSYKPITQYISENIKQSSISKKFIPKDGTVLDLGAITTKKADKLLREMKIDLEEFSATKKIMVQLGRDEVDFPSTIQETDSLSDQNIKLEDFIVNLMNDGELIVKLETDKAGGLFKWLNQDNANCFLLITLYVVDPTRNKHKSLPDIPFNIRMTKTSHGSTSYRNPVAKLLYYSFINIRSLKKQKFTQAYQKFLDHAFQPFETFLYNERLSIRDPQYRPSCLYIKREGEKGDDRGYIEIIDPPRQLTEGGNSVVPSSEGKGSYPSARIIDYDEFERLLIFDSYHRIKHWPDEGKLLLEGDMASNLRKWNAIKNLKNRGLNPHAKLADVVIRPWGLPEVSTFPRSYFNPGISHDNKESKPQAHAVDIALANQDVTLIHGPPGTGKTTVIVEIIRHVIAEGGRVIMCAPTHVAVDNVLERTADIKGISAVRVGGRAYMDRKLMKYRLSDRSSSLESALPSFIPGKGHDPELTRIQAEFSEKMEKRGKRYLESLAINQANLVCGTTIGIARFEPPIDNPIDFDVLIIDEASKATVMEFLVPAVRAKKWILVGDHRQLPPYINEQEIRIYVQRYFEQIDENVEVEKVDADGEDESESSNGTNVIYNERTNELIASLRRFHEELHAMGEGQYEYHWHRIVKLFNYGKKPIKSIEEMVNFALGSCFHYFLNRVDLTRNARLVVQHRMPSILANFLDQAIYKGNLKTSKSAAMHGFTLPGVDSLGLDEISSPLSFISTELLDDNFETPGRYKGYSNKSEAMVIAEMIEKFTTIDAEKLGFDEDNPLTIGVITYYIGQSKEINRHLRTIDEIERDRGWKYRVIDKPIHIRVSIVDRFQGQEQDIIFLSLTRSNNIGSIGFLKNLQRVNVSLSRAKQNLLVVGNADFFSKVRTKPEPILKSLAKYCKSNDLIKRISKEDLE